jgi:hypothetical protein
MYYNYDIAKNIASERNCGFWQFDGRCFFNKMECLRYVNASINKPVTFHYFDEIFSAYNWKVEPIQSLDELYKQRAIQLREKHKYLVLMISGGADSTTMLQSFLKNNIKVDEIVSAFPLQAIDKLKHTFDPKDKSPNNWMFEYNCAALPLLKMVKTFHPETKVTVLDYIDDTLDMVGKTNFYKLARPNGIINFASGFIHSSIEYIKSMHKDSTIVYAIDKPRISFDLNQKKWHFRFLDFHTNYNEFDYDVFKGEQPKTEYFYYTPDFPNIVIKQSIVVKKFLESISLIENPDSQLYTELISKRIFQGHSHFNLDINCHHDLIKKILYKDWNTEIYQANKGTTVFYNENFSSWFYKEDLVSQRLRDYHAGQLKELLAGIHPVFIEFSKDNSPTKLKFCRTRPYEL